MAKLSILNELSTLLGAVTNTKTDVPLPKTKPTEAERKAEKDKDETETDVPTIEKIVEKVKKAAPLLKEAEQAVQGTKIGEAKKLVNQAAVADPLGMGSIASGSLRGNLALNRGGVQLSNDLLSLVERMKVG